MPILDVQMLDRDVLPLLAGKEVLHEQVAARPVQAPLLHFLAPELVIKPRPVLLVDRFDIQPLATGAEEDVVPQEIGRQQRFPGALLRWLRADTARIVHHAHGIPPRRDGADHEHHFECGLCTHGTLSPNSQRHARKRGCGSRERLAQPVTDVSVR